MSVPNDLQVAIDRAEMALRRSEFNLEPGVRLTRDDLRLLLAAATPAYSMPSCPHCGFSRPHVHYIDRKGFVHSEST